MTFWEYFVSDLGDDPTTWRRRLDTLGKQGWELVSTHEHLEPWHEHSTGRRGGNNSSVIAKPSLPNGKMSLTAILKRPQTEAPSTIEALLKAHT